MNGYSSTLTCQQGRLIEKQFNLIPEENKEIFKIYS